MNGCELLVHHGSLAYFVPLIALAAGVVALRARRPAVIEVVIALTTLWSVVWFGACLQMWQLAVRARHPQPSFVSFLCGRSLRS